MKKSWIGTTIVTFFDYVVQPGSWGLSQSRRDAITAMIFPTSTKLMQSFLGAADFFHTHIPNYAGPHLSTNVPLLPLTGMIRLEPKITKQYLKSSKPQSKTPQPYTFLITLSPGSSALTPPTMLLVLSFSNSTPAPPAILLWRCNQLGYLQARGLCALLRCFPIQLLPPWRRVCPRNRPS